MGKREKTELRQLFLGFPQGDIVYQMPPLVQDVMEDAHIHILQMPDKIPGNGIGFPMEGGMHRAGGGGVIPPVDGLSIHGVGDLYPLQYGV